MIDTSHNLARSQHHAHRAAAPASLPASPSTTAAVGHLLARLPASARNAQLLALQRTCGNGVAQRVVKDIRTGQHAIAHMSTTQKLEEATMRSGSSLGRDFAQRLKAGLTPTSIGLLAAQVFVASQLTPAGWVSDVLIGGLIVVSAVQLGPELAQVFRQLRLFVVTAKNAQSDQDLDSAGAYLASAIAQIGTDVGLALLTSLASKAVKASMKPSGPAAGETSPSVGPRQKIALPATGTTGNLEASVEAATSLEKKPGAYLRLPKSQQAMMPELKTEHPKLLDRVAEDALRGAYRIKGKGGGGADIVLANGKGREVSVHTGAFTMTLIGEHLQKEALQQGTEEIYLQLNTGTRQALLAMIPELRRGYLELEGVYVRFFGPNGDVWWNGVFHKLKQK